MYILINFTVAYILLGDLCNYHLYLSVAVFFRYQFPKPYPPGSVIVYGLNMANITENIKLTGELGKQDVDEYLLTPGDDQGLVSK